MEGWRGSGEWGVGSGEWGVGRRERGEGTGERREGRGGGEGEYLFQVQVTLASDKKVHHKI